MPIVLRQSVLAYRATSKIGEHCGSAPLRQGAWLNLSTQDTSPCVLPGPYFGRSASRWFCRKCWRDYYFGIQKIGLRDVIRILSCLKILLLSALYINLSLTTNF